MGNRIFALNDIRSRFSLVLKLPKGYVIPFIFHIIIRYGFNLAAKTIKFKISSKNHITNGSLKLKSFPYVCHNSGPDGVLAVDPLVAGLGDIVQTFRGSPQVALIVNVLVVLVSRDRQVDQMVVP